MRVFELLIRENRVQTAHISSPDSTLRYSFSLSHSRCKACCCSRFLDCGAPLRRGSDISQGRSWVNVSSVTPPFLVRGTMLSTANPLLCRSSAACVALLYTTAPNSSVEFHLHPGHWGLELHSLPLQSFLHMLIFPPFFLHIIHIVVVKVHPFVLDTGLLAPSSVEDFLFNCESKEPNHQRTWWGSARWFRACPVRALYDY